jgi:TRAP transporter TAXI family solute receptor
VIVRAHSGIHTVSDLNGRNIALGPKNSSTSNLGLWVLDAFGVTPKSLHNLTSRADAAAGLKNGEFDAAFFPGYIYPDEVVYSAIKEGAYLIPIEGAPLEQLRWTNPFVRLATIPRNIYPGQDQIIPTVGIDMVVLCRRDLDESIVYDVTTQLFNAYPRLSGVEASLRFLNIDEAPATPIPLHPGAARYFRERELSR